MRSIYYLVAIAPLSLYLLSSRPPTSQDLPRSHPWSCYTPVFLLGWKEVDTLDLCTNVTFPKTQLLRNTWPQDELCSAAVSLVAGVVLVKVVFEDRVQAVCIQSQAVWKVPNVRSRVEKGAADVETHSFWMRETKQKPMEEWDWGLI